MNELKILKTRMVARDGTPVKLIYDEEGDILEILFGEAVPSTGIALTDNIILHLERKQKRAVSLMLLNFSILSEQTRHYTDLNWCILVQQRSTGIWEKSDMKMPS